MYTHMYIYIIFIFIYIYTFIYKNLNLHVHVYIYEYMYSFIRWSEKAILAGNHRGTPDINTRGLSRFANGRMLGCAK